MVKRIFGVATKEQREAKRQQWLDSRPGAIATMNNKEVLAALDGLDIAEERLVKALAKMVAAYNSCGSLVESYDFDWVDWAEDAEDALAEWRAWKGGERR